MTPAIPLRVRVVDRRAAMTARAEADAGTVQIPDPNHCPPTAQYPTIGAAILGAIGMVTAWFKEDLFGIRSKRAEAFEARLKCLEDAHNKDEQAKLISQQVEQKLAELLKQRPAAEIH